jgi:protein disulfide-isomerase A6
MKYLFVVATLLLSSLSEVSGGAVVLTKDNFKEKMQGKNAFIKFFAPWCGHCKSMKPAWDELGDVYASSSSVLIGDVDCTDSESEAVCEGTAFLRILVCDKS